MIFSIFTPKTILYPIENDLLKTDKAIFDALDLRILDYFPLPLQAFSKLQNPRFYAKVESMEILINQNKTELSFDENETLGHLFLQLEDYLHEHNLCVLSVSLDDRLIDADEQKKLSGQSLSDFNTISLETVANENLAEQSLLEILILLEQLEDFSEKTAEMIHKGQHEKVNENINSFLQVWAVLFETISNASRYHKFKLTDIRLDNLAFSEMINTLTGHLTEIKKSISSRDYVNIADVLEYEISPTLPDWIRIVRHLVDFLKQQKEHGPS
jgi:hypothetical protein